MGPARQTCTAAALTAALALTASTAAAQATLATRPTAIADAVAIALQRNPDALASEVDVRLAEATRAR